MGLDGLTVRLLKDAAPVMAKSITYLVNLTISTRVIPSKWKDARVTPNFKSGARNYENNYQLISVLPLVSKVMEYECLLHKLEHHRVRGSTLDWFRNYLTTQTQRVHFGKDLSSSQAIQFGVLQGSILGPFLFVLYT